MAGSVIGRGGCQVKEMRSEFQTSINIPDSNGTERLVKIFVLLYENTDPENPNFIDAAERIAGVVQRIAEYLQEAEVRFAGGDLKALQSSLGLTEGPSVDARILVNESIAGYLKSSDGEGGSKLDNIQQETKIEQVKIFEMLCPRSTDFVVRLFGKPHQIFETAKKIIIDTYHIYQRLQNNQVYESQYDPKNVDERTAEKYGGYTVTSGATADLRELGKTVNEKNKNMLLAYWKSKSNITDVRVC